LRRVLLFTTLGVGFLLATPQQTFDAVVARYAGIAFVSATFTEEIVSRTTGSTSTLAGRFIYVAPDKFRLDVTFPEEQLLISDGQTFWIYIPSANQVVKTKPGPERDLILFVANLNNYQERYSVDLSQGQTYVEAHFTALTTESGFMPADFTLLLDANTNNIAGIRVENGDMVMTLIFSELKRNAFISGSEFVFIPPDGVELIEDVGVGYE